MFTSACCLVVSVRSRFSGWLVSGYARVFVLLSVVIVALPFTAQCIIQVGKCHETLFDKNFTTRVSAKM